MRLLLDTHVVLWQISSERELSAAAQAAIAAADALLLSVASFAEIGVKASVGKLRFAEHLPALIADAGVRTLGLSPTHGLAVANLPLHHRDPFDRLIIAQAVVEDLTVVTADDRFRAYDVALVDA